MILVMTYHQRTGGNEKNKTCLSRSTEKESRLSGPFSTVSRDEDKRKREWLGDHPVL